MGSTSVPSRSPLGRTLATWQNCSYDLITEKNKTLFLIFFILMQPGPCMFSILKNGGP